MSADWKMVVLFTDFGLTGPYVGQMKAVLARLAPAVPVVDLFADAPRCNPRPSAYLLAAFTGEFPPGTVFLCVVDPGVGSERRPSVVRADGRWYVGPDNGLFNVVAQRARDLEWWDLTWRPARLSSSFHGRDLFAPVAAKLALGEQPPGRQVEPTERICPDWPEDLAEVVYLDHFGNAMTGIRASRLPASSLLLVGGRSIAHAPTFSAVPRGEAFWYGNSSGLVEIAVNCGEAGTILGLEIGTGIGISDR